MEITVSSKRKLANIEKQQFKWFHNYTFKKKNITNFSIHVIEMQRKIDVVIATKSTEFTYSLRHEYIDDNRQIFTNRRPETIYDWALKTILTPKEQQKEFFNKEELLNAYLPSVDFSFGCLGYYGQEHGILAQKFFEFLPNTRTVKDLLLWSREELENFKPANWIYHDYLLSSIICTLRTYGLYLKDERNGE